MKNTTVYKYYWLENNQSIQACDRKTCNHIATSVVAFSRVIYFQSDLFSRFFLDFQDRNTPRKKVGHNHIFVQKYLKPTMHREFKHNVKRLMTCIHNLHSKFSILRLMMSVLCVKLCQCKHSTEEIGGDIHNELILTNTYCPPLLHQRITPVRFLRPFNFVK